MAQINIASSNRTMNGIYLETFDVGIVAKTCRMIQTIVPDPDNRSYVHGRSRRPLFQAIGRALNIGTIIDKMSNLS